MRTQRKPARRKASQSHKRETVGVIPTGRAANAPERPSWHAATPEGTRAPWHPYAYLPPLIAFGPLKGTP